MKANDFGKYIRKLRNDRKLTIRQLELYSSVSNSYLSQLENGKRGIPSPDILKKLSKGLKHPYSDLLEKAGYIDESDKSDEANERDAIIHKIATEFPDADLMFHDLASMTAEDLEEVYEFIKFKSQQKK